MPLKKPCIDRERFINKIRSLDYRFNQQGKRVSIWRKKGGTHFVSVPHTKLLAEDFARHALRQCGLDEDEIQEFLAAARTSLLEGKNS